MARSVLLLSKPSVRWLAAALAAALLVKYIWTLLVFDTPLGYDVGIYRYLFLKHAEGWPPFLIGPMDAWAREHALGLFAFTSLLVKVGVPVDWLIGWIWNLMPVALAFLLAGVWARKRDVRTGVLTALACLLSIAQFHGFMAMYWKTYAALLFAVLALEALDRRRWPFIVWGALTFVAHQQTALLLGLVALTVAAGEVFHPGKQSKQSRRFILTAVLGSFALAILWYLPHWEDSVSGILARVFQPVGETTPGGSFPPLSFYLLWSGILWAFGIVGIWADIRKTPGNPWQYAVLWSLLAVVSHFFFYRRFILHLDFFLLPFVAIGMHVTWARFRSNVARMSIVALIAVQSTFTFAALAPNGWGCTFIPMLCAVSTPPMVHAFVTKAELSDMRDMSRMLPSQATVLVLDPEYAPWIRGWLPWHRVLAPGVLSSPWDAVGWERFILGSPTDRRALMDGLPPSQYMYVSPVFTRYYGEYADALRSDPCFESTGWPQLLYWKCP